MRVLQCALMNALKQGDIIRHPARTEWGRGVVVDVKGTKIQAFFENHFGATAVKLDASRVGLERLEGERVPLLEHLPVRVQGGVIILDGRRVSFDDLFKHFMQVCPKAFSDETLYRQELSFKQAARAAFAEHFGGGRGLQLITEKNVDAITAGHGAILNAQQILLSPQFERAPFWDAMCIAENALGFTQGVFEFLAQPPGAATFDRYVASLEAVKPTGKQRVTTWPLLTLFPFLAQPERHMFLKPGVTKKAAEIVGVDLAYDSTLNWTTYARLLRLCEVVDGELAKRGLPPKDHIETQSFLWVAVTYP